MLTVIVDWERQTEEMILVTWQTDDDHGQIAWIVGRPQGDNADDERKALEAAVAAERIEVHASGAPLYRLIISEQLQMARAIFGNPARPLTIDGAFGEGSRTPTAVLAAAHALVAAKLDPEADTAA